MKYLNFILVCMLAGIRPTNAGDTFTVGGAFRVFAAENGVTYSMSVSQMVPLSPSATYYVMVVPYEARYGGPESGIAALPTITSANACLIVRNGVGSTNLNTISGFGEIAWIDVAHISVFSASTLEEAVRIARYYNAVSIR